MEIIEVGLRLCAASELREALGLLAEVEGRSLFRDQEQRVAAYNSLLWHCHMKGNQVRLSTARRVHTLSAKCPFTRLVVMCVATLHTRVIWTSFWRFLQ